MGDSTVGEGRWGVTCSDLIVTLPHLSGCLTLPPGPAIIQGAFVDRRTTLPGCLVIVLDLFCSMGSDPFTSASCLFKASTVCQALLSGTKPWTKLTNSSPQRACIQAGQVSLISIQPPFIKHLLCTWRMQRSINPTLKW